ncbi:putative zinc ribbon protein, partial [Escherichia coli]|uniref:putative zinc ribbon protein n=4 Tax=Escherichia coli TaxID=562 RepID=UPI0006D991EC
HPVYLFLREFSLQDSRGGSEIQLIKRLQQFVLDALPVVRKASWHCRQCHHDYYGERYCTHCQTGGFSIPRTTQEEICEF